MTGQLQGEVRLDRCVYFARSAMIDIPSAVRELALKNVTNAALLEFVVNLSQPMHEEDEIGAQSAIDQELSAPMAVGLLLSEQILLGTRDGTRNFFILRQL